MQISNLTTSDISTDRKTPNSAEASRAENQFNTTTFSNMNSQQMEAARTELWDQGKLTFHQNAQMLLMDGTVLASINGGRLVTGSSNMYKMIDESIAVQKSYGGAFNAQANIASYTSLRSILENYDQNN
ncbi:MAG: hypothetical protein ACRYFY_17335 [Janthinobacterium lividum]